jgi:hypothetical protein
MLEVETRAAMIADAAKRKTARNAVLRRQTELAFTGPLGVEACAKCILLARSLKSPVAWPPGSAANESWSHEQFCQSAVDPSKAVVAQGTRRAAMSDLGQSRRLNHVGMFASPPTTDLSRGEPTLWATFGHSRRRVHDRVQW